MAGTYSIFPTTVIILSLHPSHSKDSRLLWAPSRPQYSRYLSSPTQQQRRWRAILDRGSRDLSPPPKPQRGLRAPLHPSQPQNRTSTPATATMAGPCAGPHHNKYLSQPSQPQLRWRTLIGLSPTIVGKYLSPPPHATTAKMLSSYQLGHNHGK